MNNKGRLCGAVYLDEAFRRHIFGLHKYMAKLDPKDLLHFMKKEWEGPKRSYQGGSAEQHSVTLPLMKHTFKNKGGIVVALNKYITLLHISKRYSNLFVMQISIGRDLYRSRVQGSGLSEFSGRERP